MGASAATFAFGSGDSGVHNRAIEFQSYQPFPQGTGGREPMTPPDFDAQDVFWPNADGLPIVHTSQGYALPNATLQHPGPSHPHDHSSYMQPSQHYHPQEPTHVQLHQRHLHSHPHPSHHPQQHPQQQDQQHPRAHRTVPLFAPRDIDGIYQESFAPVLPGGRTQGLVPGPTTIPPEYSSVFASSEDLIGGSDNKGEFADWVFVNDGSSAGSGTTRNGAYQ